MKQQLCKCKFVPQRCFRPMCTTKYNFVMGMAGQECFCLGKGLGFCFKLGK